MTGMYQLTDNLQDNKMYQFCIILGQRIVWWISSDFLLRSVPFLPTFYKDFLPTVAVEKLVVFKTTIIVFFEDNTNRSALPLRSTKNLDRSTYGRLQGKNM